MKALFKLLISLIVIITIIIGLSIWLIPKILSNEKNAKKIATVISQQVKDVEVEFSDLNVSLFPKFTFDLHDLVIRSDIDKKVIVKSKKAILHINLFDLIKNKINIKKIAIINPQIFLEFDKNNKIILPFKNNPKSKKTPTLNKKNKRNMHSLSTEGFSLSNFTFSGGRAELYFQSLKKIVNLQDINLTLKLGTNNKIIDLGVSFITSILNEKNEKIFSQHSNLNIKLDNFNTLLKKKNINLNINGNLLDIFNVNSQSVVHGTNYINNDGKIDLAVNLLNLQKLSSIFQHKKTSVQSFKKLIFSGNYNFNKKGNNSLLTLPNIKFSLDDLTFSGEIKIPFNNNPLYQAKLHINDLDLGKFITKDSKAKPVKHEANEKVIPYIDFPLPLLKLINLDAKLSIDNITLGNITITKNDTSLIIKNGRLISKTHSQLNDGLFASILNFSSTGNYSLDFNLTNIEASDISKWLLNKDLINGKGNVIFTGHGIGTNTKDFVKSLNGNLNFTFNNGFITGINISKIAQSITSLKKDFSLSSLTNIKSIYLSDSQRTDFTQVKFNSNIVNGIIEPQVISLVSPFIEVKENRGNINLNNEQIKVHFDVKLNDKAKTNHRTDDKTFDIPMLFSGNLSSPKVSIDKNQLSKNYSKKLTKDILKKTGLDKKIDKLKKKLHLDELTNLSKDGNNDKESLQKNLEDKLIKGLFKAFGKKTEKPKEDSSKEKDNAPPKEETSNN